MSDLIYCVVVDGVLYSNRIEKRLPFDKPDGIYSMDMGLDDFISSLAPADVVEATRSFRKASKMEVVRGVSFHDGMVPENPVKYKIPIKVVGATYDEFEEIEVVIARDKVCYYLQSVSTNKAYVLMDLAQAFKDKNTAATKSIKGVTPEMRIVCAYHLMELKKKEESEPVNAIKLQMEEVGAKVLKIDKTNRGFEVAWSWGGVSVVTTLDKNLRVVHAGYCVSGYDQTQSARSIVNLMKTYREEGSSINVMRSPD